VFARRDPAPAAREVQLRVGAVGTGTHRAQVVV